MAAAIGTYLHGPLLPRNPALADWLLARALEHAGGDGTLEPLGDELEPSRTRSRPGGLAHAAAADAGPGQRSTSRVRICRTWASVSPTSRR